MTTSTHSLIQHIKAVKKRQRRFENAFQGVSRMILEGGIEKTTVNGKTTYDFRVFRTGPKHVIGMYDEINSFVSYVKDAAEGGSSKEMAFVLVGEPGKPFSWSSWPENTEVFSAATKTANTPSNFSISTASAPTAGLRPSNPRPMKTP
jgi:hypothetical protein